MLSAAEAQSEIAKVRPGQVVDSTSYHRFGGSDGSLQICQGILPEDSPLRDRDIDVLVAIANLGNAQTIAARVAIEHTPGDQPAVMDVKANPLSTGVVFKNAMPRILSKLGVRRAELSEERTNVGLEPAKQAGYKKNGDTSVLIAAA